MWQKPIVVVLWYYSNIHFGGLKKFRHSRVCPELKLRLFKYQQGAIANPPSYSACMNGRIKINNKTLSILKPQRILGQKYKLDLGLRAFLKVTARKYAMLEGMPLELLVRVSTEVWEREVP
jgi:hypothetical protein